MQGERTRCLVGTWIASYDENAPSICMMMRTYLLLSVQERLGDHQDRRRGSGERLLEQPRVPRLCRLIQPVVSSSGGWGAGGFGGKLDADAVQCSEPKPCWESKESSVSHMRAPRNAQGKVGHNQ